MVLSIEWIKPYIRLCTKKMTVTEVSKKGYKLFQSFYISLPPQP